MGKRSKALALILLVGAVGALIVWQILRNRSPVYDGKTAAGWFAEFRAAEARHQHQVHSPVYPIGGSNRIVMTTVMSTDMNGWLADPAADGLRGLGTNAALYLANEFQREESSWAPVYRKLFYKLPKAINRMAPKPPVPRTFVRMKIVEALHALGTNVLPAVPPLVESYPNADPFTRSLISDALRYLPYAPGVLHPILEKLAAKQQFSLALDMIGDSKLRTPEACAVLGGAVLTGDLATKQRAVGQLTYIGPNASVAVPALITALTNEDKELRYSAVSALAAIGPSASAAVPTLEDLTKDPSELVQHAVRRALRTISGEPGQKSETE